MLDSFLLSSLLHFEKVIIDVGLGVRGVELRKYTPWTLRVDTSNEA
jgi:hypothetical protein